MTMACLSGKGHGKKDLFTEFNPHINMFHSEFLDPLSSFSVGYKSESNDANDSKKEDLSQLFCI